MWYLRGPRYRGQGPPPGGWGPGNPAVVCRQRSALPGAVVLGLRPGRRPMSTRDRHSQSSAPFGRDLSTGGQTPYPPPLSGRHALRRTPLGASVRSEAEVGEARVVERPRPSRPSEPAVGGANWKIVDAGDPPRHPAVWRKLPVLVPVGPVPAPGVVPPLVGKPDGNSVVVEGPELLDQPIFDFPIPLATEEGLDLHAATEKLRPVPPDAVWCVCGDHPAGIAAVPGIFGRSDLGRRSGQGERRERRAGFLGSHLTTSRRAPTTTPPPRSPRFRDPLMNPPG